MRHKRLDLNLLMALDALLVTRSVSKAALALHVTQPAMSGSLARLREYFGDGLLVSSGRAMELSPLAQSLVEPLRKAVESIDVTLSHRPYFDPLSARRHFTIGASDYSALAILQPAVELMSREAPGITMEIVPAAPVLINESIKRREIDFSLLPEELGIADHPRETVMREEFVCLVWSGNEEALIRLDMELYLASGHVVTRHGPERRLGFEQQTLDRLGVSRREEIICPNVLLLGPMLVGTQRIATVMRRLAQQQALHYPLRVLPTPVDFAPLRIALQWHKSRESDGGITWFRNLTVRALAQNAGVLRSAASN